MSATSRDNSVRRISLAVLLACVATLGLLEATARLFWKLRYDIPLSRPGTVLCALYPELWQVEWKGAEYRRQNPARVLLLGGSVLHPDWGSVEQGLRERLTVTLGRPVIVFNMAEIAHTSRDSAVKYRALEGRQFDLVVFYHGINDARANNVPPALFRADYSHYAWYDAVRALDSCPLRRWLALPCTASFLAVRAKEALGLADYLTMDAPRPEWVAYGADLKSAAAFEQNLHSVLETARSRRERVLLMTFASHVPDDYSLSAFHERKLDYTLHLSPIELWGSPPNVTAAVARHNDVVRAAAVGDPDALLVDQAALMPRRARYFNDVCHLTTTGSALFVENMHGTAARALAQP